MRTKADIEFAEHPLIGQPPLTCDQKTLDFHRAVERTRPRVFPAESKDSIFPWAQKERQVVSFLFVREVGVWFRNFVRLAL